MKIKRINQIEPVVFTGGVSFRTVVEKDNMGFGVNKTIIPIGGPYNWCYKNHLEVCYCIKGKGELTDLSTGIKTLIVPDVVYILDNHDNHTFEAVEDTVLISVFNPPLKGYETHDKSGNYPSDYIKRKSEEIYTIVNDSLNKYDAIEEIKKILL